MAYSPPLDGAVGVILFLVLIYGIGAFLVVTIAENIVLWRLGWGSFLNSLMTSFIMNLASTIVGYIAARVVNSNFLKDVYNTIGNGVFFLMFILLFIISVVMEGGIMLGIGRSRHETEAVWRMAVIANVISYILLGIAIIFVW